MTRGLQVTQTFMPCRRRVVGISEIPQIRWQVLVVCLFLWACGDTAEVNLGLDTSDDLSSFISGPPSSGEDGAPCRIGSDCLGGLCRSELETGVLNGYCFGLNCGESGDVASCNGGSCFASDSDVLSCYDVCQTDADCRVGYQCSARDGAFTCEYSGGLEVTLGGGGSCIFGCEGDSPLRIDCGFEPSEPQQGVTYQWALPYQLDSSTAGFALSVWPENGRSQINVLSARNSDDAFLALKGADSALNVTSFFDNDFVTVTFPSAPIYADFVNPPTGLLQVQSTAERLCLARAQGPVGDTLDIHIYLVGAAGLTAETVDDDDDFQTALSEIRRLLGLGGIEVGEFLAVDSPSDTIQAYRIIRDPREFGALLGTTVDPGSTGDANEAMVLNLMLVDDIALSGGPDTIGQSALLPGPPGLHGMGVSGVVVETTTLREDPVYLSLIIAHESAHFLGLRHTSELSTDTFAFGRTDPLDDTPECEDVRAQLEGCLDYTNLMFPLAPPQRSEVGLVLSDDQSWVLRRNPLIR